MFCRKCGEKLGMNDKFCSACGEPVHLTQEEKTSIVLEPPKDLVWNIEGFPKDKKPDGGESGVGSDGESSWKKDNQNKEFSVEDFYVDNAENISTQRLLDIEIEKLNQSKQAREEAVIKTQEGESVKDNPREEAKQPEESSNRGEIVSGAATLDNRYDNIFIEEDMEEESRHSSPLRVFILTFLIIFLLAEAAFLGFEHYMPENPTVVLVNEKITQGVMTIQGWFETEEMAAVPTSGEDPIVTEPAIENPAVEDPVNPYPANENIKEISLNPSLVYVSGKDYGNADVNQSLPVTENAEDVIQTVVAYDSKWIDYVNNKDKGVMELTAPGSQAEKNTLSFTNEGKIKETFISLQIGEIRKGVKGYYIWVREEIELLENGTSTRKVYNWIYQVAPVENEMKIVDYFSYK